MRLLFFPSDLGGGFGHISRCLALAHEAAHRGHTCAFVMNDTKYEKQLKNNFRVFISKKYPRYFSLFSFLKSKIGRLHSHAAPLFTEISGLDYQVVRDGFVNANIVKKKVAQYLKIVKTFKPDVLIGDTNLLVWMLSKKADVPVVQIVRYASHPKTAKLLWWKDRPESIIPPDASTLFNPLLLSMDLQPIKKAEDLLQGDLYIVPSLPEIEPIPKDKKTVHVGELTLSKRHAEIPSWLREIDDNPPLLYVTIGGGAGPVGNTLFFSTIVDAFAHKAIQVIVSTSSKFDPAIFPNLPPNIRFFTWVPGKLIISKADVVIFHGGYGTMMETVTCGKPAIIIPFQSEQEGNGRRLEQLGSGLVVKLSQENYIRIEARWKYGTYSFFVQNRYELTAEELYGKVHELLHNNEYRNKAEYLQSKVKNYHGPQQVMELVEKYWS
ncbi:MAG: hypothetical protein GY797_31055 [Deltaproteobacteria bacterium]|nr:hypothetical protein [Deltaproteobacteria bacterium]